MGLITDGMLAWSPRLQVENLYVSGNTKFEVITMKPGST
jgi:hypothetical protein